MFYSAFDVLEGLATGVLVRLAASLPADRQTAAFQVVQMFLDETRSDVIALLGILVWLVAILASSMALARACAPRASVVLIGLGGLTFGLGHPAPTGTVGMAFFLLGVATLQFAQAGHVAPAPRQSLVPTTD